MCLSSLHFRGQYGGYGVVMDTHHEWAAAGDDRAIRFTGSWREYLPIAATNALLIICHARRLPLLGGRPAAPLSMVAHRDHRRHARMDRDRQGDVPRLPDRHRDPRALLPVHPVPVPGAGRARQAEAAGGIIFLFEIALIYLGGFARFRALRYRLSRTYWHGIRGGSDDPGWNYGGEYLGRYRAVAFMTMFIIYPVGGDAAVELALERDELRPAEVSRRTSTPEGLKGRWALIYAAPFAAMLVVGFPALIGAHAIGRTGGASDGPTLGAIFLGDPRLVLRRHPAR